MLLCAGKRRCIGCGCWCPHQTACGACHCCLADDALHKHTWLQIAHLSHVAVLLELHAITPEPMSLPAGRSCCAAPCTIVSF